MALEAVVFPQEHLSCAAMYAAPSLGFTGVDLDEFEENGGVVLQGEAGAAVHHGGAGGGMSVWVNAATCARSIASGAVEEFWDERQYPVSPPVSRTAASPAPAPAASGGGHSKAAAARRRRRRLKVMKNKEEAESQRRNHIAVERNRRRQMNEYLAVLRSLMPPSYAQRGDQASIVAGAINFVKELEQLLQSLEEQKRRAGALRPDHPPPARPFAGFFTFPQYSATVVGDNAAGSGADGEGGCGARPGAADIEVIMAESHANVRVLAPRRPRQLLRMVVALQCLGLTVLHLHVTTTADHLALYSFSLKMEDECRLSSVDEIAAAVNQMVSKIAGECIS